MEKGMLSWCLQNSVPLKNVGENVLVLTYEQLTLETGKMISVIVDGLELDSQAADQIMKDSKKPSSSSRKSNQETQKKLKEGKEENLQKYWYD